MTNRTPRTSSKIILKKKYIRKKIDEIQNIFKMYRFFHHLLLSNVNYYLMYDSIKFRKFSYNFLCVNTARCVDIILLERKPLFSVLTKFQDDRLICLCFMHSCVFEWSIIFYLVAIIKGWFLRHDNAPAHASIVVRCFWTKKIFRLRPRRLLLISKNENPSE